MSGSGPVGAKHPLLSLCGPDLAAAWGKGLHVVSASGPSTSLWTDCSIEDGSRATKRSLQQKLWDVLHEFGRSHPGIVKLDCGRVRSDPDWAARELASLAQVGASAGQLKAAAEFVRAPSQQPG